MEQEHKIVRLFSRQTPSACIIVDDEKESFEKESFEKDFVEKVNKALNNDSSKTNNNSSANNSAKTSANNSRRNSSTNLKKLIKKIF